MASLRAALTEFWRRRSQRGKVGIVVASVLVIAVLARQPSTEPGLTATATANASQSPLATALLDTPVLSPVSATTEPTSEPAAEPTVALIPTAEPTAAPVTLLDLKGRGIKKSRPFTTTDAWTLHYSFDCKNFGFKGNFIVSLYAGTDPVGVLVNELARKGASSTPVYDIGTFHLEMNSECSWHVRVIQP